MRIVILLLLFALAGQAQNSFQNKIIKINTPALPGTVDHLISIQNLDNLSENTSFWSDEGTGEWLSPYCNIRVTRTAYDSSLIATVEWSEDFLQEPVSILVAAMPNRRIQVEVIGGDFQIYTQHVAYGGKYMMYQGNSQFWPIASLPEGKHTLFIPYPIRGQQGATIKVFRPGGCNVQAGRIFYMN